MQLASLSLGSPSVIHPLNMMNIHVGVTIPRVQYNRVTRSLKKPDLATFGSLTDKLRHYRKVPLGAVDLDLSEMQSTRS